MIELVIVWYDGSKDIYEYADEQSALKAEKGMRIALGNQIQWSGIREKVSKRISREAMID